MKTYYQFLNEGKILPNITYYHGCSSYKHGESILKDGFIKPGNEDVKRGGKFTPAMGRTYATPNIREAIVYTIGGVFMGSDHIEHYINDNENDRSFGRYGYLFEIDDKSFTEVDPDEDYLGESIYILEKKPNYSENKIFGKMLLSWNDGKRYNFLQECKRILTELQYQKCIRYDDFADFAVAGKKLNKFISEYWKSEIIKGHTPVANKGILRFKNVWKFDKFDSKKLGKDGERFFELAKLIYPTKIN